MMNKYPVRFTGEGYVLATDKQTLLEASLTAGIPIFHECGGQARCSTCRVLILAGHHSLSSPTQQEKMLNTEMKFPGNVRLACQTKVTGKGVAVSRIIRDESDISLYIGTEAGSSTQILGEEKELAMFFLDIRNFTAFVETHLPFDVIHIVRKLFTTFQKSIEAYNGKIVETAGDGLYAVFGLKQGFQNAVASAVEAGFSVLNDLETMNKHYFNTFFNQKIDIGIGIHAGTAVGGSIRLGTEDHMVMMGHDVNIAARLQDATKQLDNNFIISAHAYELLPARAQNYQTAHLQLKGISKPLQVYMLGKPYSQTKVPAQSE